MGKHYIRKEKARHVVSTYVVGRSKNTSLHIIIIAIQSNLQNSVLCDYPHIAFNCGSWVRRYIKPRGLLHDKESVSIVLRK